jgi:hypothetical protein
VSSLVSTNCHTTLKPATTVFNKLITHTPFTATLRQCYIIWVADSAVQ